jgi:ribosomal protein S18 acetylase RimI-like enzyme
MCEVEKFANSKGYSRLHLSVHPENLPAVKFYEKLGWERSSPIGDWDGKMHKTIK